MKKNLLFSLILFFCFLQNSFAQYRTDGVYLFSVLGKNGIYHGINNNRNDEQNLFGLIFKENGEAFLFYDIDTYNNNSVRGFTFYTSLDEFNNPTYFGKYQGISYSDYVKKQKNAIIGYILLNEFKYKLEDISEYGGGDYRGRRKIKIQENIPIVLTGEIKHSFTLNNNKINHVATSKLISINETLDLNFIEVPKLSKESLTLLNKKTEQEKLTAENNSKKQAENERLAKTKYNEERIKKLKTGQVGDRICFSQDWIHRTEYKVFLGVGNETSQSYKMRVICYIERKEGDRYQIRVANIESSNKNNWSYPKLNGVELKEQSLHWIKPNDYLNNIEWNICE